MYDFANAVGAAHGEALRIRLIEAGRFDNLVWDVTYTGSRKIAVLF